MGFENRDYTREGDYTGTMAGWGLDYFSPVVKWLIIVNVAVFPAVPRGRAGVRLMLNTHQTERDILDLVRSLAKFVSGEPESRKLPVRRRILSPMKLAE